MRPSEVRKPKVESDPAQLDLHTEVAELVRKIDAYGAPAGQSLICKPSNGLYRALQLN